MWTCNQHRLVFSALQKAAISAIWPLMHCFQRLASSRQDTLKAPHGRKIGWLEIWRRIYLFRRVLRPFSPVRPYSLKSHFPIVRPLCDALAPPSSARHLIWPTVLCAAQQIVDASSILLLQLHLISLFKPCVSAIQLQSALSLTQTPFQCLLFPYRQLALLARSHCVFRPKYHFGS